MPLSGEAKKAYQRNYMRKRRTRIGGRKPTPKLACAWCRATHLILVGPPDGPFLCSACAGEAHREATARLHFRNHLPGLDP